MDISVRILTGEDPAKLKRWVYERQCGMQQTSDWLFYPKEKFYYTHLKEEKPKWPRGIRLLILKENTKK